jgi:predicted  nucleic acid-binding Zn-ribbon protein
MTGLKDIASCQRLIDCSLVSTPLSALLSDMCDLIAHQQQEINDLKLTVQTQAPVQSDSSTDMRTELAVVKLGLSTDIAHLRRDAEELRTSLTALLSSTESKFRSIESTFDGEVSSLNSRVTRVTETTSDQLLDVSTSHTKLMEEVHLVRDLVDRFDVLTLATLLDRLAVTDNTLIETNARVDHLIRENEEKLTEHTENIEAIREDILDQVSDLNARVGRFEVECAPLPDLQDILDQDGDLSLEAILRSLFRNTRRLDHFDVNVNTIRAECENVASGLIDIRQVVQKFNHQIYDFGLEVQRNTEHIDMTFRSVKSVLTTLGTLVSTNVTDMSRLGDTAAHLSATANSAVDEIVHLLNLVSGRTFQSVPSLDEVALEATELSTELQTTRAGLDIPKVLRTLDGCELGPMARPQEVAVPSFQRKIKRTKSILLSPERQSVVSESATPESLILLSMEEIRVRIDQAEQMILAATSAVNDDCGSMRHLITEKIDSPSFDRVVKKLEGMLVKVQKDVNRIQIEDTVPAKQAARHHKESSDLTVTTARSAASEQLSRPVSAAHSGRHSPASSVAPPPASHLSQSIPQLKQPSWPQPANPVALKALRVQADVARDERKARKQAKKALTIPETKKPAPLPTPDVN